MPSSVTENVKLLAPLTNDGFLAAFDVSLKLLEKNMRRKKELSYQNHESKKDEAITGAEALCSIFESTIQEGTTQEELEKELLTCGLQIHKVNLLTSQLDLLKDSIAKNELNGNSKEELIDLQWKFGVVAGSSIKEETGRTFVQVKLLSRSSEGSVSSQHIEMSLEKFYDFLHQLEKAKASFDYINYL
ncbi:COMM domain-containing protein 7-like isoform X1 [Palaemon carinicauda]|uniref:COMM domain-containing protein 7-like isoform X1 n=1 Tax=Palaemon carinicauda TaxID=392227 RepID=UPI0035B67D7F